MVARLVLAQGTLFFGVGAQVPLFLGTHSRGAPELHVHRGGGERRDEVTFVTCRRTKKRRSRLQVLLHPPLVSWARRGGQCPSA